MTTAPEDPLGTVRRHPYDWAVAVRGRSPDSDDHIWYILDTGGPVIAEFPDISSWPIVYRAEARP